MCRPPVCSFPFILDNMASIEELEAHGFRVGTPCWLYISRHGHPGDCLAQVEWIEIPTFAAVVAALAILVVASLYFGKSNFN